jgi:hypothetical protein
MDEWFDKLLRRGREMRQWRKWKYRGILLGVVAFDGPGLLLAPEVVCFFQKESGCLLGSETQQPKLQKTNSNDHQRNCVSRKRQELTRDGTVDSVVTEPSQSKWK